MMKLKGLNIRQKKLQNITRNLITKIDTQESMKGNLKYNTRLYKKSNLSNI